jgi:imidazolonepropionase-like amidohydrolase
MKRFLTCTPIFFILVLLATASPAWSSNQIPAPAQSQPIALVGGRIYPINGPVIKQGTVLFDKGVITAIGEKIPLPQNTQVIDISGQCVYPGLIAANTYLGLVEIEMVDVSVDVSENAPIAPNVITNLAVNPDSELIPVTRANGIAFSLTVPGGRTIKGLSSILMMDGWTWEDMTLKAPAALHIRWPNMHINRKKASESRKQRDRQIDEIKNAFAEARAYWKAKQAEKNQDIPHHDTDIRWEAMGPVLKKEIPVVVNASTLQEIQAVIAWAQEEDIRLIVEGGYDAWRVADLLKQNNVSVLVHGTHNISIRESDSYDTLFSLPAKLHQAGIEFCIGLHSPMDIQQARNISYQAGSAVAFGLPREEALRAITITPATMFGVADQIGSIEKGKDATLIVVDGDPLEIRSTITRMFIQGRDVDLTSKHTMLYEKYKEKYNRGKK